MPTDIYRRPGLYIPQVYCWVASRNSLVSVMHFYILCFIILVSDAVIHLITGFLVFSATILYLLSWHTIFNHFLNHYNVTSHHLTSYHITADQAVYRVLMQMWKNEAPPELVVSLYTELCLTDSLVTYIFDFACVRLACCLEIVFKI